MNEWREHPFSDALVDGTLSYGIVQPGVDIANGVPVIKVNNIKNGTINTQGITKTSSSIEEKYSRTRLKGGELLITVVGIVGECAIVPKNLEGYNVVRAVSVARIKPEYDIRFVKYCFQLDDIKYQIYANTNDTVQPTLNLTQIKEIVFRFPHIQTQRAIAEVLSSLDDKIDLLTRQNVTLEALAQTYFRQWFVEGASEDYARLGDFFPVRTGKKDANFASDYGLYPFFTCSQTPLKADSYSYDESSVLLAGNGDFSVKWYRGKFEAYQRTYVLTPYDANDLPWLYFVIKFYLGDITAGHRGSVINFITKGMIEDFNFPLARKENFVIFKSFSTDVIAKLEGNNAQIQALQKLRDTLLPKLTSGEVRVRQ